MNTDLRLIQILRLSGSGWMEKQITRGMKTGLRFWVLQISRLLTTGYALIKIKYLVYIRIQTLHVVLDYSSFGNNDRSSWRWSNKLRTAFFWTSHSSWQNCSSSTRLDGASVHSHFQISPEMLFWDQVWSLAGPLPCFLGGVRWVVVVWNCKNSLQPEVLTALDMVFPTLCSILHTRQLSFHSVDHPLTFFA